jgi:hypothetical protein
MKNFFLTLSGLVFGLVAALHVVRYIMKWAVVIGPYTIPMRASMWATLVALVLCIGCLVASGKR